MPEPLAAFAPRRCLESDVLEHGGVLVQDATVLFLDLIGFTPLTDRLGRFGSRGTEELSRLLRGFFTAATDVVLDFGGDPIAFGGDALTILFDGSPQAALQAANDAAGAILRLTRGAAGTQTLAGPVTLEARIGIARGSVASAVVRSTRRLIPVHLGPGLDLAVAAEREADAGHVVVHPSTTVPTLKGQTTKHSTSPGPDIATGGDAAAGLARLVHPVLLNRLTEGRALLESHRSIAVAFVRLSPGGPADLSAFLAKIGKLLELVNVLGGELVQVSGGDKGTVAMTVFGAPVAHGDDPIRAVQAMLELRRWERSAAVGIATGPVFAALLGSERRRFSAHSGHAVNLAARLMEGAAGGQILVDPTTWESAAAHLRQDGLPALRVVKGREEPVQVRAVAGWRRGRRRKAGAPADPPLVGRHVELSAVERLLDDLGAGSGRQLVLSGEPGIGKSRLVRESVQRATTRDTTVVLVDTGDHPWGQSTGFWRDLIGGLTATPVRAGRRQWLEALAVCLPDATAQLPVLGKLLGLRGGAQRHPPLPPELEAELVQALVSRLPAAVASLRPLLLVVENAHHLDQSSRELLDIVGRALPGSRAGLVVTRRTDGNRPQDHVTGNGEALVISELTASDVALLAEDVWAQSGGGSAPPWLATHVVRRAGGNPLFVRTVTRSLCEHWEPGQPPPAEDVAAGSLAGLLAERVDRLPVLAHQLLNVLAVVGQPCSLALAGALLTERVDEQAVALAASTLLAEHLAQLDSSDTVVRCRLMHDVLQQVVYHGMSHAERTRLHQRLAQHLSESDADPVEVAEHVDRLDDPDLARRWFPLAAISARSSWNLPAAVGWWRRSMPLLFGPARDEAEVELLEILLVAGRANEVLAAADVEESSEPSADGVSPLGPELLARRLHAVAEAALVCGDLDRSESAAYEVMRLTESVDEPRHQRAAELLVLALCAHGDFAKAIATAQQQLERARRSEDARALSTAQASLGAALLHAGAPEAAVVHYERALVGSVELGNVVQEIHVLSDLAGCAFETRRYKDCVGLLAQARASADRIGYLRHLAFNLSNEAQLRAGIGDPHAISCAAAAVQRSLEMGDLTAAANSLHTWVTAKPVIAADPDRWHRLRGIDARLDRGSVVAADAAELAVAAARRGRTDDALRAAHQATRVAQETDQAPVLRRATLARLIVELRRTAARESSKRAASLSGLTSLSEEKDVGEVERAEIGLERWRVTRSDSDRDAVVGLLHQAFAAEPSALVRRWFGEVGESPPDPPAPLPPPVGIGRARTTRAQLEDAFSRLEAALPSIDHATSVRSR